jgi:hypothetical protein
MALIDWVSKKQATIEISVFGAEFNAMKHGNEKLQVFAVSFAWCANNLSPSLRRAQRWR